MAEIPYDLTEDRLFSNRHFSTIHINVVARPFAYAPDGDVVMMHNPAPWELHPVLSDNDLNRGVDREQLIIQTGDASEINFYNNFAKMEKGEMCELCGEPILNVPWTFRYSCLCPECDRKFDALYNKKESVNDFLGIKPVATTSVPWWHDV